MVAISTPMVASLAVRVRKTSRFCPWYLRAGRLSKKAGTPEAKLRKKQKKQDQAPRPGGGHGKVLDH